MGKVVIAGDDNCIHVIDLRSQEAETEPGKEVFKGKEANASPRAFKPIFCGDKIVSVGFARYHTPFPSCSTSSQRCASFCNNY